MLPASVPVSRPAPDASALSPRVEALDVFVQLLSAIDAPAADGAFYNRICEAICRLTSMERVILMLYDDALRDVRAAGSHGVDAAVVADVRGTLEETPVAQRALAEDRVVEISEGIERELPERYVGLLPITTLTCTPVAAGGRWFGVIFADRGGGRFELTDDERHAMWTLGKMAALAASARIATREQERVRGLADRIVLAREIHEQVIQRLFGVSLVLGAGHELEAGERDRARREITTALSELRTALSRPLAAGPAETRSTLAEELERLAARHRGLPLEVRWAEGTTVPTELEPLAQSVLREALRNIEKHARPERVDVRVESRDGVLELEVVNDGVDARSTDRRAGAQAGGMGLRLAAFEALQAGGLLEFGPAGAERWRVRLTATTADR